MCRTSGVFVVVDSEETYIYFDLLPWGRPSVKDIEGKNSRKISCEIKSHTAG
jgi:hypothetical protein